MDPTLDLVLSVLVVLATCAITTWLIIDQIAFERSKPQRAEKSRQELKNGMIAHLIMNGSSPQEAEQFCNDLFSKDADISPEDLTFTRYD